VASNSDKPPQLPISTAAETGGGDSRHSTTSTRNADAVAAVRLRIWS
jgi:hypothetical protein